MKDIDFLEKEKTQSVHDVVARRVPAQGYKCQKKGHYQKMCLTKNITKNINNDHRRGPTLGVIHATGVAVTLNQSRMDFKIDTGAE